jgi:type VI secretion system protein ImpH
MASDDRPPPDPMNAPERTSADPAPEPQDSPGTPAERARQLAGLLAGLARAPWDYGFCHTLRRLDCLQPERPRIGATLRTGDDPVRLGQKPSLRFAPAELAALEPPAGARPSRLLVYFQGMLGPNGPLPLHLTEYVRDRERQASDHTLARFLDIFNHRMLALLYRAWAQAQPAVSFDRPRADRFGTYLAGLGGTGMPAFQGRDAMPDLARRHFAGHLSCQNRHAEGLRAILGTLLGMPVRIDEWIGHWLTLPPDCRLRLGESPQSGALGRTTTLGGRVWDHQNKFRIRIGPIGLADYLRLLPGGEALARVRAAVRHYVGDQLHWDLNLVLTEPQVPRLGLGVGARLGWTTWLASGRLGRDGDDLKLDLCR